MAVASVGSEARGWWLFSPTVDLLAFGGSALASLLVLAIGAATGWLHKGTPDSIWIAYVLMVDVAHVWTTVFRTYTDPAELRRRPLLYLLAPLLGYAGGVWVYREWGSVIFWSILAYVAVFHFVRQQYGWVAMYRARMGERDPWGRVLDGAVIYAVTIYPLLWWHTHLPRRFGWFFKSDFYPVPATAPWLMDLAGMVYWGLLVVYVVRATRCWVAGRPNPGKDLVVFTTAVCWYTGIIALNSDYAFTVTNVLIHGIPYIVLLYFYGRWRYQQEPDSVYPMFSGGAELYLGCIWVLAYVEELFWDRAVWHQRAWFFGSPWQVQDWHEWVVPLLVLPQLVHYVLDGFVWRRGASDGFVRALFRGEIGRR